MASYLVILLLMMPVGWILYCAYCLARNYLIARKVGVSMVIVPISPENILWIIIGNHLIPFFKRLPFGNGTFTRFTYYGWQSKENCAAHLDFGDAFITVTPGKNWLYVCNAEALIDIFRRGSDFPRPFEIHEMLNLFGPNISTAEGPAWQKQRKITASSFNERNMKLVWDESLRQATEMLNWWKMHDNKGVRSTARNISTLTLHVISTVGFGKSYPFQSSIETVKKDSSMNYRDALSLILENVMLILILGPKLLGRLSQPKKLARLGQATMIFKQYMTDMYEEEKGLVAQGKSKSGNLMTSLIRASDEVAHAGSGLTENEIYGNMFIISFAGHDTTAHTLTFTINLLAAHPEVQNWMREELQYYLHDDAPSNLSYEESFPKLKRTLAVFLETLRLYDPVVGVVKTTGSRPQTLTLAGKTLNLPPGIRVNPNILSVQCHPRYWGTDSLQWRPSRWIVSPSTSKLEINPLEHESIYKPPDGCYIPFAEGTRSCPGRKFAQVEHVAVMASLFRAHRVQPVLRAGESMKQASKRIMDVIDDRGMKLLMQMLHPENAVLEWQKC